MKAIRFALLEDKHVKCKALICPCTRSSFAFLLPMQFTACLHGGGGPHVGGVTRLSIKSLILI